MTRANTEQEAVSMSIDELLEHLEKGRSGEAGIEAAATIRALREALNDGVSTLAAVRAASVGSDWKECAVHFHELCGATIARTNQAGHGRVG